MNEDVNMMTVGDLRRHLDQVNPGLPIKVEMTVDGLDDTILHYGFVRFAPFTRSDALIIWVDDERL